MSMTALEPFLGTWDMEVWWPPEAEVPSIEGEVLTTFEWVLDGAFILQRSTAPAPIPQGHILIGADEATGGYTQHYFDSRGVARVYMMTFDGRTWTLERTTADFTTLEFSQRYVGTFADEDTTIEGAWEICHDGSTWQTDFHLSYHRRA